MTTPAEAARQWLVDSDLMTDAEKAQTLTALLEAQRAEAAQEQREKDAKIADTYKTACSPIGPLHTAGIAQAGTWIADAIRHPPSSTKAGEKE